MRATFQEHSIGLHPRLIKLLKSWLEPRNAKVIVGGAFSAVFKLINMLFQGTVLGPPLWNAFFADARIPIRKSGFEEIVFADDLNAFKIISKSMRQSVALSKAVRCQEELHKWEAANRTSSDPTKETHSIIGERGLTKK